MFRCSIEVLYHFSCNNCGKWFSVADIEASLGDSMACPHCHEVSVVNEILNGKQENVEGISWRSQSQID